MLWMDFNMSIIKLAKSFESPTKKVNKKTKIKKNKPLKSKQLNVQQLNSFSLKGLLCMRLWEKAE